MACMDVLRVDCSQCRARGPACSDCVISVLLGPPAEEVVLDGVEQRALKAMAESGLLPPLRLTRAVPKVSVRGRPTHPGDQPGFAFPQAVP